RRDQQAPVAVYVGEIVSEQRDVYRPLIVKRDDFNLAWSTRAEIQLRLVNLSVCQRQVVIDGSEVLVRLDVDIDATDALEQSVDAAADLGLEIVFRPGLVLSLARHDQASGVGNCCF